VFKTDAQWKDLLGQERYDILRHQGTERPGTSELLKNKADGVYTCAGCGLPLFFASTKFESGTGWPSYFDAIKPNVAMSVDTTMGMKRTEIHCVRCNGHMGHVFEDGPKPTGLRYCVDGLSLSFTPVKHYANLAEPAAATTPIDQLDTAVFAGGCFWCTEAVFEPVKGVIEVVSGYAGGSKQTANYSTVSSGRSQHAESIRILYDATKVSYETLLELFFTVAHDPTQLNKQGNDVGTQYRSVVFVTSEKQRQETKDYIAKLQASGKFSKPIVTKIETLSQFFPAEDYHQDYVKLNPGNPYVQGVAIPKVRKLFEHHGDLLKDQVKEPQ
jgi:peptide methionine sulfoxide reductase msrA/msrB